MELFVDSSLIDADASNNSVVDTHSLRRYLNKSYRRLEERLDDLGDQKSTPANSRYISTTDPDASVTRHSVGGSKLRYKTHRSIDPRYEVTTATRITAGSQDEGDLLKEMIEAHQQNTQKAVDTVVGDSKYGKIDNFLICHDLGKKAHMPHPDNDRYTCPAGEILRKRSYYKERRQYEYKASSEICRQCRVRRECTRAKDGRTLKRHLRQDELDIMFKGATSRGAKRDIKTRQHLSERSFAHSTRYGFKRARWRRSWRMEIQDFLIAAVQNIRILIDHSGNRVQSNVIALFGHACSGVKQQRVFMRLVSFLKIIWRNRESFSNWWFSPYRLRPTFNHSLL
jgi:hypothetical protein